MSYHDPPRLPVKDPEIQEAINEVRRALIELARDLRFIDQVVTLKAGVDTVVRHGLGRRSIMYSLGAPTGATATGRIVESLPTAEGMTLTATGYGATITVPVRFW